MLLHPGLNNLPLAAAGGLPSLEWPPSPTGPTAPTCSTARRRGDAESMVNAGDDAHLGHPHDCFGG